MLARKEKKFICSIFNFTFILEILKNNLRNLLNFKQYLFIQIILSKIKSKFFLTNKKLDKYLFIKTFF